MDKGFTRCGQFVLLLICSALVLSATIATAQRGSMHSGSPMHPGSAMHSGSANFRGLNGNHASTGHGDTAFRRHFRHGLAYPGYGSLPFPFFGDNFDPNDIYSTGYPVSSAPPPYLMQALQGLTNPAANSMSSLMTPPNDHEGSSNDPLMIEFQNGRYVRINGPVINGDAEPITFPENSGSVRPHEKASKLARENSVPQTVAASPLPAVTLIFRDGHSEEVRDYTIVQSSLYARGDYYSDGYWNKKIDLATVNVSATLEANAEQNVKFVLPSSPNEVVTRP